MGISRNCSLCSKNTNCPRDSFTTRKILASDFGCNEYQPIDHTCRNCRYLAMERINTMPMYYCSINNDEENAKQGNDEINKCPDFDR